MEEKEIKTHFQTLKKIKIKKWTLISVFQIKIQFFKVLKDKIIKEIITLDKILTFAEEME